MRTSKELILKSRRHSRQRIRFRCDMRGHEAVESQYLKGFFFAALYLCLQHLQASSKRHFEKLSGHIINERSENPSAYDEERRPINDWWNMFLLEHSNDLNRNQSDKLKNNFTKLDLCPNIRLIIIHSFDDDQMWRETWMNASVKTAVDCKRWRKLLLDLEINDRRALHKLIYSTLVSQIEVSSMPPE